MISNVTRWTAIQLCLCLFTGIFAAEIVDLSKNNTVSSVKKSLRSHSGSLTSLFEMSSGESLRLLKQIKGYHGSNHFRYQQMYKNVPVYGHHILVKKNTNGMIMNVFGTIVKGIEKDSPLQIVHSTNNKNKILDLMKKHFMLKHEDIPHQQWHFDNEFTRQVIYLDKYQITHLGYEVSFFANSENANNPSRPHYIIDARTLKIVDEYENIQHAQASGPGGNEKTGYYEYGKEFPYLPVNQDGEKGYMETDNVATYDLNHDEVGFLHMFEMPYNNYKEINGAYSPINDAHFFGTIVFEMYKEWFDTAPLTFKLLLHVHYGEEYENAFWNGKGMYFGDGKDRFYPLVALDVVSHEVSHGFTEQNSNLIYTRQSGGINEAFSDIAAKASEYYLRGSNPWTIGEDIFKNGDGLRFMDDPTKDGKSIGSAIDYHDEMNVHYSSGVFNKAFYLLAITSGWNTKKAFEVFVLANQAYWEPYSSFKNAALGAYTAAEELGYEADDVFDAFIAVDVDINSPDQPAAVPQQIEAIALGTSTIRLDWTPGQLINYYTVYYALDKESPFKEISNVNGTDYLITKLETQKTYYFRIRATNDYGVSEFSEIVEATTLLEGDPPQIPENLAAEVGEDLEVELTWNNSLTAESYIIYYAWDENGPYYPLEEVTENRFSTQLSPDFKIYMKVSAVNNYGESNLSDPVMIQTDDCQDPILELSANRYEIAAGQAVFLMWETQNTVKVRASGGWQDVKRLFGVRRSQSLYEDTKFVLEAVNACGKIVIKEIEIKVVPYVTWEPYQRYSSGQVVMYNGNRYRCRISHFSLSWLNPQRSKQIWLLLD